jgi:glycosyltransferase involved in cell wall biosynthesis
LAEVVAMSRKRTLLITAPRGSGGSYAHLSHVVPRLRKLLGSWEMEVHAPSDVLRACFGSDAESWMRPLSGSGYSSRLRWEFVDLPRRLQVDPRLLVWAPFGPPLNLRLAARTVWMSRNLLPLLPGGELELSAVDHVRVRALRALFVRWARRARRTICVSSHARERLARLARVDTSMMAVIPHGVDPLPKELRCSSEGLEKFRSAPYIFNAGQPVAYRRTRELVKGFVLLSARRSDVPPLVVAGKARGADSAYERDCLELLAPLERAGRAFALGQVSHDDTMALMAGAHTFAYPSVHEDCPNVVLEALSAARVSMYADIPAVRELAAEAGVFVRDPQVEAIAAGLEQAVFDGSVRSRVARAAALRAALFTWERTAERTAGVLEAAVG